MRLAVLVVVFLVFSIWSFVIVGSEGPAGLVAVLEGSGWARQIFVDLALSLVVAWAWLGADARARGIAAWPYVVGTLALGSIAVLAYLIHRELASRRVASPVS